MPMGFMPMGSPMAGNDGMSKDLSDGNLGNCGEPIAVRTSKKVALPTPEWPSAGVTKQRIVVFYDLVDEVLLDTA